MIAPRSYSGLLSERSLQDLINNSASPFSGLLVVFNAASQKIGYSFMKTCGLTESTTTELISFMAIESYITDCESTVYFVSFEKIYLGLKRSDNDDCFKVLDATVLFVCKYKLHHKLTTIFSVETWQGVVPMIVQLDSKYMGVLLPVEYILGTAQHITNNELLVLRNTYSGWIFVMCALVIRHDILAVCMVERDCVVKLIGRSTISFNNFPGLFQPEDAVFDKCLFAKSKFKQDIIRHISQDHYDTTNLIRLLHCHDKKRKFNL